VLLSTPHVTTLDVLAQCDEAIRRVKSGKIRGIAMVDEPIIRELKRRRLLDNEIIEAVQTKRLFLLFQPIVSLETGKITGAEALLRFRRIDGSLLNAGEFMDSLVRTASLSVIDEMLIPNFLETHSRVAAPLLETKDFRFSFNVSPGILANVGYAERILAQIAIWGSTPSSFTLEILEEGLMPSNGTVRENLGILHEAGMLIAVDDFGIGYSNMLRLSRLPVHELKIPRELLTGIKSGDSRMLSVLETTLGIAKSLHLIVVAEGVEEASEADHLRNLGCQYAQGVPLRKGHEP